VTRNLLLFACLAVFGTACQSKTTRDFDARVGALEARYHTQERQIKELTEDVERLIAKERRRAERAGAIRKHRKELREARAAGQDAPDTDEFLDLFDAVDEEAPQEPEGSEPAP
jgi:uncharacterized coiled-coil protein SlyX